jgi:hypothetical protein
MGAPTASPGIASIHLQPRQDLLGAGPRASCLAQGDTLLQAKDCLILRLTGRRCTDRWDASGANAFDQSAVPGRPN